MALQMTLAQQMVAKKFNLEILRDNSGNYRVEDRVIASFYVGTNDPSKRGIYTNRKLDTALQAAVEVRKEHDAEMTRRSGFSTDPVKVTPPRAKKVAAATAPAKVVTAPVVHKPRVMIDLSPIEDEEEVELEFDDVELDNTGERLKKYREPPRYSKSESSFLRGARVIVKRPHIGQESLARDAVLAMATAKYVAVAVFDIVTTLDAAGLLNAAGKRLLEALPKPKKGKG